VSIVFIGQMAESALVRSRSADDVAGLVELRDLSCSNEWEACSRAWSRAQALINEDGYRENHAKHVEAYNIYKQAICGTGESEYSKVYTKFVEERIEAFCSLPQIDMEALARFEKSFSRVFQYGICFHQAPIGFQLSLIAKAEQNVEKALRLHQEAVF
jgi:hypothetical protein